MKADTFNQGIGGNSIKNQKPLFVDKDAYNYEIDSSASPAKGAGMILAFPNTAVPLDALGRSRSTSGPTLGAYE
jgi:hypothetical protein